MGTFKTAITLQGASGSPDDRYVNNLSWDFTGTPDATDFGLLADAIVDFYTTAPTGGTGSVVGWFSEAVATTGHIIRLYEQDTSPPHLPLFEASWSLPAAITADGLPEEVAICLSFHGTIPAGSNTGPGPHLPARARGRIFLGPIAKLTAVQDGAATRPDPDAMATIVLSAGQHLIVGPHVVGGWNWVVWSEANGTSNPVIGGWCDNAFDTQRRRGSAPTSRVFFS